MYQQASNVSFWNAIIGVLIGGGISLASSIVSAILAYRFTRKNMLMQIEAQRKNELNKIKLGKLEDIHRQIALLRFRANTLYEIVFFREGFSRNDYLKENDEILRYFSELSTLVASYHPYLQELITPLINGYVQVSTTMYKSLRTGDAKEKLKLQSEYESLISEFNGTCENFTDLVNAQLVKLSENQIDDTVSIALFNSIRQKSKTKNSSVSP